MALSNTYQTKKGKKTAKELNEEIAQQKAIVNAPTANDTTGDYPGRVKTPFTIGQKSAVPGTIPEGQTQATFNSEADYQKIAVEKRKGLQEQALGLAQQEQELLKPVDQQQAQVIAEQNPQYPSLLEKAVNRLPSPIGISQLKESLDAVNNPQQAIKQAGTELLVGGAVALGGTGFGVIRGASAIASQASSASMLAKGLSLFSLKNLVTGGIIASVIRRKAGEADTILTSSMSGMESTIKDLKEGRITYEVANQLMNEYEANINSAEKSVKTLSQIDVANFAGLKDSLAKYQYARMPTGIPSMRRQLELTNVQGQLASARAGYLR